MTPKKIRWDQVKYHWEIYLFIIPTLILIALFQYYPAASGIFHSFYRWNGSDISEPVGFLNYLDLLKNPEFWNSFRLAFILGGWNVVKMIPALLVAVAIHRCRSEKMNFFYRTLFVVPMVIPGLIVVLIWRSFFFEATSGYLNKFLIGSGLFDLLVHFDKVFQWGGVFVPGQMPAWLGDPRLIVTACIVWGFPWVGSFAVLTHLAKLQGISKDVYEAAEIDGVSWFSKFTKIELPLIMGSIYLLLVFVIIDTVKDAGMILALAGLEGGPGGKATVPALFMLRKAFLTQEMGAACAIGIVLTLVVLGLQKLSTLLVGWTGLTPGQKTAVRCTTGLVGLGILAWSFQQHSTRLVGLGLIFAIGSIPFPQIFAAVARLFPEKKRDESWVRPEDRALLLEGNPLFRAARALGGVGLRGFKHIFIWFVLVFAFLPLYLMIVVSVKDNQQFYLAPATLTAPMHWDNWRTAWESVTPTVANSLFISTSSTVLTLFFALCGAYFFARLRVPLSNAMWNAILLLMMMPAIANLVPLFILLRDMNLLNTLSALIIVGASGGQIFGIFMLRGFVSDIPQDLFEAAEIDGASHFQQIRHVVLPLSGPILGTVGVMHFIGAWNDFVLPLIVMRDHARLPVMVQLLRMAGEYIKLWGPLMAGYAIASIPIIILFVFAQRLFIKGMTEGAVKG
ncbi:MAG: ABC transporter permease subunit [Kiritimatiellae bacterium]|nr:ABC transporter permease subunit [Kiritimatiellia bacterium]MCO5061556.1 ABC transporter permease subunit [Kiritimatiellia bacterium]MCO5067341.1 ABC transporter permease subunit [Kiritimatiellia bacterium]